VKRAVLFAVLLALAVTAAAGAGTRAAAACKPGVHTIGKTTYRIFCGPASASVKVQGKTHSFRNGSCLTVGAASAAKVFTMSIGTLTVSKSKPKYSYLGITVPGVNHDGVFRRAVVTWAFAGKRYSLYNVKLRLSGNRTRGAFSGRIVGKRVTVTGSFRCR